jgi:hypothetical protein
MCKSEIAEEPCGQYQCMPDARQGMASSECNIIVTIWSAQRRALSPGILRRVARYRGKPQFGNSGGKIGQVAVVSATISNLLRDS